MQIAIDGPSGSGKSTIARELAAKLGFIYIDTGAMYRAVGLYGLRNNLNLDDEVAIGEALKNINLDISYVGGSQHIYLNGEDVTMAIRTAEGGLAASAVARFAAVRDLVVKFSSQIAEGQNAIMDGRDIGTVVLPAADLKIFLKASPEERVKRRCKELEELGKTADFDDILQQIIARDFQDENRVESPLKIAENAHIIDSTAMNIKEVLEYILNLVSEVS